MLSWPWEESTNPSTIFHAAMTMLLTPWQCAGRELCARSRTENPQAISGLWGGSGPSCL